MSFDICSTVALNIFDRLPEALHTRQGVYLAPLIPAVGLTRELTSGSQGATHNPVFSKDGKKVAWTEMVKDGYEADR